MRSIKKISLVLAVIAIAWIVQPAQAQVADSSKNHIEIKKKVKKGLNGRTVTKIKIEGKGTPASINSAAEGAIIGKPAPRPIIIEPTPVVITPAPVVVSPPAVAPTPDPTPTPPTIVVVTPQPEKRPVETTTVTTSTETKPLPVAGSTYVTATHVVRTSATNRGTGHVYHKVYRKKVAVAPGTKTTTTVTTVKKSE